MGKNKNAAGKTWVHPPEALQRGHIVYNVKFLGHVEVEQPKGIEVVKEAIRKMKFNKQIKRAEGQKPPKVELTISVDGVTVQEPKYKVIQHQYPLHRISYCADDKSDKRMFTFIAKEANTSKHHCFVFDSDKCAEEITLTIGQAFELAYKKFVESSGPMDMKKQYLMLQKKVQQLTQENLELKARVADLERLVDARTLEEYDRNKKAGVVSPTDPGQQPVVGRRLENLIMDDSERQPQTNGTAAFPGGQSPQSKAVPALAPPPPIPPRSNPGTPQQPPQAQTGQSPQMQGVDLFGAPPFNPQTPPAVVSPQPQGTTNPFAAKTPPTGGEDPFGMGAFQPTPQDLDQQIQRMDRELMDLQAGFSQGLSFGTEDFSLEDLDPLNQK